MPEPGLVDRQELLAWVSTDRARSDLPRLIRRLILEMTPASVRVGMPADEGVQSGGWDGTVRSPETIRWVPEGLSLWELSTNTKASQKASGDRRISAGEHAGRQPTRRLTRAASPAAPRQPVVGQGEREDSHQL